MATLLYMPCFCPWTKPWTSSLSWLSWKQDIKICRWVIKQFPIAMNTCQHTHPYLIVMKWLWLETHFAVCITINSCSASFSHSAQRKQHASVNNLVSFIIPSDNIIRQAFKSCNTVAVSDMQHLGSHHACWLEHTSLGVSMETDPITSIKRAGTGAEVSAQTRDSRIVFA